MEEKYIALTFDDGPNVEVTPAVIERLKKYGIVATFFVNGRNINEESAKVMKEAFDMGCQIANHSQNHLRMNEISKEEMIEEIEETDNLIEKYIGEKPTFFRPPFIAVNKLMHDTIDETFICGFCPSDWDKEVSKEKTAEGVLKETRNGNIILLHDSSYNLKTALALDTIVPELQNRGYTFLTVSELFKKFNVTAKKGVIYSNVIED